MHRAGEEIRAWREARGLAAGEFGVQLALVQISTGLGDTDDDILLPGLAGPEGSDP